jgi:hypothetical protein
VGCKPARDQGEIAVVGVYGYSIIVKGGVQHDVGGHYSLFCVPKGLRCAVLSKSHFFSFDC